MATIRLIEARPLSESVTHFSFRTPFRHRPGQYLALEADLDGSRARRYYSIASPPSGDGRVELCIRHDGEFGAHLLGLRPGDAVDCGEPAGRMRLLDPARPAVYFAAGTGVSPLRAILRAQLQANPGAVATLVLGARRASDLLYRGEFEALAASREGFRFLPTLSRAAPGWTGLRGRVTDHVELALAARSDLDAYFCGHPAMVASLRERLAAAGVPDDRQSFERY